MIHWAWLILAFIVGSLFTAFVIGMLRGGAVTAVEEAEYDRWAKDQRGV